MYSSDEDYDSIDFYQPIEERELEKSLEKSLEKPLEKTINNLSKYGLYKFTFFTWLIDTFLYVFDKIRFKII